MLADDVIHRLKEAVPDLKGRVEGAASLVQLMQENKVPQTTPAANVISSGLQGGQAQAGTGFFTQAVEEIVSVFLSFRNVDGVGKRATDLYLPVRTGVIAAMCGWAPATGLTDEEEPVGVFRLRSGQVLRMQAGTLIYQIDFAIGDQLRIET